MKRVCKDELQRWLEESKTADGRRRLIADGAAAAAARGLLLSFLTW
jgi:hypothetical protein